MIVTDKFVFIHFFRTGGTFINELLLEHVGGKMLCYHGHSSIIPNEYKHLPVIGIVRNPWDWYVSVYYHCVNYLYLMRTPTALNYILDYEPTSFEDSIKKLLTTSSSLTFAITVEKFFGLRLLSTAKRSPSLIPTSSMDFPLTLIRNVDGMFFIK